MAKPAAALGRAHRALAMLAVAAITTSILTMVAESAVAQTAAPEPPPPEQVTPVPSGAEITPQQSAAPFTFPEAAPVPEVRLPEPATVDATVGEAPARIANSPLLVESSKRPVLAAAKPGQVRVEVLDQRLVRQLGGNALAFRVSRRDATTRQGEVNLAIDYAGFEDAYGADWIGRARLVAVPACALTTPQLPACQTRTDVPFQRDPDNHRFTITEPVTAAPAAGLVALPAPNSSERPAPGAIPTYQLPGVSTNTPSEII